MQFAERSFPVFGSQEKTDLALCGGSSHSAPTPRRTFRDVTILSVSGPNGRLLLYLFNDKTTPNALVCDHSPVYLTIEAKLRDKFLLKVGTSLLDLLKLVRELSSSGKVLSCCML